MAKTEAQKQALKKYDEAHKDQFQNFHFKINKANNADVLEKLNKQANKQGYILELIRQDIEKNGI